MDASIPLRRHAAVRAWSIRFDRLDVVLTELMDKEQNNDDDD